MFENHMCPSYRNTINRIGVCLCIMLVLMQGVSFAWQPLRKPLTYALPEYLSYFAEVLTEAIAYLSCFLIPAVLFLPLSKGCVREPIWFRTQMSAFSPLLILTGLAAVSAASQINAWFMAIIGYGTNSAATYSGSTNPQAVGLFISVALVPAFCEELLFRGVIYGNLRRFGIPLAATVSALLFSLMHANLAQTFYTFVAGVVLALCYEFGGSIWCSTLLHLLNNLYSCVSRILLARLGEEAEPILYLVNLVIMAVGAIAALALILLASRRKSSEQPSEQKKFFGSLPESLPSAPPVRLDFRTAVRGFFSPGMSAFLVLHLLCLLCTAVNTLAMYFMQIIKTLMESVR